MLRGSASPYGSSRYSGSTEAVATEPAEDPLLAGLPRPRAVLVAGASGFLGGHLLPRLLSRGHRVRAFARSPPRDAAGGGVEWRRADVTDPESLRGLADDQEVVVHLAGVSEGRDPEVYRRVHVEGTRNLLAEAERAGAERFVFVSAAGARPEGSPYFGSKFQAEREVRDGEPAHVIFRPSIVYGPGDRFTAGLVVLLRRLPVFPLPGRVSSLRLRPVSVEDVTDALAQAVERSDLEGRSYDLAGPERLEFASIVRIVARRLGLRRPVIRLPAFLAGPVLRAAGRLGAPPPLSADQLDRLREIGLFSGADAEALRNVFRVEPLPFPDAIADYL